MANLPTARGRLQVIGGRAVLSARCPMCGREHRYDKGEANEPEVAELRALGFSEEWMPCQFDLPGNFWRITFGGQRRRPGGRGGQGGRGGGRGQPPRRDGGEGRP